MVCYSPRPIEDYYISTLPTCEARIVREHERAPAIWNLFWMSTPTIDNVPGSGRDWWRSYSPQVGALAAVIIDVVGDEVLYRKLLMPPQDFMAWFERDDHTVYECHTLFGDPWHETVMSRADEAMRRTLKKVPRVYADKNGIRIEYS